MALVNHPVQHVLSNRRAVEGNHDVHLFLCIGLVCCIVTDSMQLVQYFFRLEYFAVNTGNILLGSVLFEVRTGVIVGSVRRFSGWWNRRWWTRWCTGKWKDLADQSVGWALSSDGVCVVAGGELGVRPRRGCAVGVGYKLLSRLRGYHLKVERTLGGCHRIGYCSSRWYSWVKKLQSSCPWAVSGLRRRWWCCFSRTSSHSSSASNKKERDKSNIVILPQVIAQNTLHPQLFCNLSSKATSLGCMGWSCLVVGIRISIYYIVCYRSARVRVQSLPLLAECCLHIMFQRASLFRKPSVSILNYSDFFTFMSSIVTKKGEKR